jgi:hypothetical protein
VNRAERRHQERASKNESRNGSSIRNAGISSAGRILWTSNAPWAATGYGQQTAQVTTRLKKEKYEIAIAANYGLEGASTSWNTPYGEIPIYEPHLDVLFERNIKANRLTFTTNLEEGIRDAEIIFLALPTPPGEDGIDCSEKLFERQAAERTERSRMDAVLGGEREEKGEFSEKNPQGNAPQKVMSKIEQEEESSCHLSFP